MYWAHTLLKEHNIESGNQPIYKNEDLTAQRAKLAYDAQQLKKVKKIIDCWTSYGEVMVKDTTNRIKEMNSPSDLLNLSVVKLHKLCVAYVEGHVHYLLGVQTA